MEFKLPGGRTIILSEEEIRIIVEKHFARKERGGIKLIEGEWFQVEPLKIN